jgi:inosose dehydratase
MMTRRTVLAGLGAAAAMRLTWLRAAASALEPALYPPMDLSRFDTPVTPAPAEIRIGYASITWGGHDAQAIDDIAALGFEGVQLRSNILPEWEARPQALADLLASKQLTFVALSSGSVDVDKPPAGEIATHVAHATFLRAARGRYLQCTDARPKRAIVRADYERLGRLLTEIGKRTADLGIPLGYHNHMGTLGEKPEEVAQILDASDPRYVKLELDVAHYQQGGGDPVKAIRTYADRLLFLHIKDVQDRPGGSSGTGSYQFVELGRGKVDVKACFAALHEAKFRGWAVVELDAVPDRSRTPKEAAAVNKQFLHAIGAL